MSKEFRKRLGFTSKEKMKLHLRAKDIVIPNYTLLQKYNSRLSTIFNGINGQLRVPFDGNIDQIIIDDYTTMKDNNIIQKLNNHGRACEAVYYSWRMGTLAEIVFKNFIASELKLKNLEKNGSDDLTDPSTFSRTGDADLIDNSAKVRIDVQCGTGDGETTIKKQKFDHASKHDETTYIFFAGLLTGTYALINLNDLTGVEFKENKSWENVPCWTVPEDRFKPYYD